MGSMIRSWHTPTCFAHMCSLSLDVGWATACAFCYVGELTVLEHATAANPRFGDSRRLIDPFPFCCLPLHVLTSFYGELSRRESSRGLANRGSPLVLSRIPIDRFHGMVVGIGLGWKPGFSRRARAFVTGFATFCETGLGCFGMMEGRRSFNVTRAPEMFVGCVLFGDLINYLSSNRCVAEWCLFWVLRG